MFSLIWKQWWKYVSVGRRIPTGLKKHVVNWERLIPVIPVWYLRLKTMVPNATVCLSNVDRPFLNSKHTAVSTDYRLICTGLASFISKLFIGSSENPWNLIVSVLYGCAFFTFLLVFANNLLINKTNPVQMSL
jgi:hypothetical protein